MTESKMIKNPWLMFVGGLMIGLVVGYVIAERQAVPPAVSLAPPSGPSVVAASQQAAVQNPGSPGPAEVERQLGEIRNLLAKNPGDGRLLVAQGNIFFDAKRWEEARLSYEEAIETIPGDPNILTDLAVVYRNLGKPERALEILAQVIEGAPDHWQAVYNRVIVLHFDLHSHDEAVEALGELEKLAENNSQIPDLSGLASQVRHQ
jgi:tetratricopeptide (TPR) repeat protein